MLPAACTSTSDTARARYGGCFLGHFPRYVEVLASPGTRDCGIVDNRSGQRQLLRCVQQAQAGGQPYFFGQSVFGGDAGHCEAVLRTADGQLWQLRLSFDLSIDDETALYVARCNGIEIGQRLPGRAAFFELQDCVHDSAAFERIRAALQAGE